MATSILAQPTVRIPLIDLKIEYVLLQEAGLEQAILASLAHAHYVEGPAVKAFEQEFAAYCGTRECIALDSGTAALHLAMIVLGIGSGDEVVVPANTFIATASAVVMTGATPVFIDADAVTFQMDLNQLEASIGPRCKAVIGVDLYGQILDMNELTSICKAKHVHLIEDACQAHGATFSGLRAGSFGEFGCFSFYPAKNLGAFGDGGAITTNDSAAAERLRSLRDHGRTTKYEHSEVGYNYRMDALQGVVLSTKLKHLDVWNQRRRELAATYREQLENLPVYLPAPIPNTEPVWHLFTLLTARRGDLGEFLAGRSIDTGVHYPVPLHLQPAFRYLGHRAGDFPVAEKIAQETISLPLYPHMTDAQFNRVVEGVRDFFASN